MRLAYPVILMICCAGAAAPAAVSVYGNTTARACYEAALSEQYSAANLGICDDALGDRGLGLRDRVATYVNRGILHVQHGAYAEAIADYDRAIALDAAEPDAYLNKGLALLRRDGSGEQAAPLFTMAIERGTREPAIAYYVRGVANELNGDIPAAYADLRRAAQLAPDWDVPARDLTRFEVVN